MTGEWGRYFSQATAAIAMVIGLTGCAINPVAAPALSLVWHDTLFDWSPGRVTFAGHDLFSLKPALGEELSQPALKKLSNIQSL